MNPIPMQIRTDWKFVIMLIVTIVGVGVPIWLWYADQSSHSLQVSIVSQTALQPNELNSVSGLKLSIDGRELKAPYLTVVNIKNDGAKPIPISDFEGPLEIKSIEQVKIVRAQQAETYPKNLQPIITSTPNLVKLKPLLLNSNDSITVAILTTGEPPTFSVRARIAGIPSVELGSNMPNQDWRAWIIGPVGFALLIIYSSSLFGFLGYPKYSFQMRRWNLLFIGLSSLTGSVLLVIVGLKDFEISEWPIILAVIAGVLIGSVIDSQQRSK